ncbi:Oxoglutarate/iron-dependent oxygenase [Lasiodiplodia theobromae]|nr:Oxoglutarate/iron-dependent oxygenase [Lasiodiplodia theobromae]
MSNRELASLAPGAWAYSGLAEDYDQPHGSAGPRRRRRCSQKEAPSQLPPSPQSSAPPQSPTPTPASTPADHQSESELSSVPDDLSDVSYDGVKKKRKLHASDSEAADGGRPKRNRRLSKKALENRAAEVDRQKREKSTPSAPQLKLKLKLSPEKLQQLDPKSPSSAEATPDLPAGATPNSPAGATPELSAEIAPEAVPEPPAEALAVESPRTEEQGRITTPPSSQQNLAKAPAAAESEQCAPADPDPNATPTIQFLLPQAPTPPKSTHKRGRPEKADASLQLLSPQSVGEDAPRRAPRTVRIPDPIADGLEHLVDISKQLMNYSGCPLDEKPPPVGSPEVWADGRQALCESLPYYRAYQSAGYCSNGFAHAFMFDQEGSTRDYIDSEVVIARAGGGLSKDKTTGKMAREADQTENCQVKSVKNSIDHFNPVAILCGDRNQQCPSKMPHVYNVLDWFKPTHIWYEKVGRKVNIRYRFEKLCRNKQSWWASSAGPEPTIIGKQAPPETRTCSHCHLESQQVYLQGWMCLQASCPQFWKLDSGYEPQEAGLLYDPRFLKQHTPWSHSSIPQPLRPNCFALGPTPMLGDDVSWAAAKGLVCPQCGRCNSREAWEGWYCGNPDCDFALSLPHADVPVAALHEPYHPLSSGYTLSRDTSTIPPRVEFVHNYRINYFTIPGVDGFIAHFIANKTINEEPDIGPDAMWTDLQTTGGDLGLLRRPLATSTLRGTALTQHFCVNYGMPYKFIAATASRSFDTAAHSITATRSRLNWAARHCVGPETHNKEAEFNELLALGYFEQQRISYHDDGEFGLGPTIATLSIGAPATMKIRLKAKHYHGISKKGLYVTAPPVPGCVKYEERCAVYRELEALKKDRKGQTKGAELEEEGGGDDVEKMVDLDQDAVDQGQEEASSVPDEVAPVPDAVDSADTYTARLRELPEELKLKLKGNAKDVLTMHLGHGDIVVMHGAKMQQYYEHAVDPVGKLRFALTCRYIDPDSLKPEDRPDYEVKPDTGDYDGSRLPAVPT